MIRKICFIALAITFISCSKGGDAPSEPTPPTPTVVVKEPDLTAASAVTVDIDPGPNVVYAVIGTAQKIDVKLAAVPSAGVTIEAKLVKVANDSVAFVTNPPITSSNLTNTVNITGLVPGVLYNLTVLVTSKNTATNLKKIEFKMAAK